MARKVKTIIIGAIVVIAGIVFARTVAFSLFYAPDDSAPDSLAASSSPSLPSASRMDAVASSSLPSRLLIPALNINAAVQYVGVNAEGNMRAPSNFTDVAWYKYGAVPGMKGSAVISGHVDNGLALAGVFKHLSDLRVGDDIYITKADGGKLHFVISDIEIYPYDAVPTNILFNQNDTARLNLVTCDGAWVAGQKTYDHRLVIYSELES